jgi:hypothetical protein
MGALSRRCGIALALALAGLLAAPALADVRLSGRTSQDRAVFLRTDDSGLPVRVTIRWHAPCEPRGRYVDETTFLPPFDRRSRRRFRDAGTYRHRDRAGRYRVRVRMVGRRVAPRRWRGTFRGRATVRRDGIVIATCETREVRWRVRAR